MSIEIHVTQKHIDHGQKKECRDCPVALAVDEQLSDGHYAKAFPDEIHICEGRKDDWREVRKCVATAPQSVAYFIEKFDHCGHRSPPEPFTFCLDLPAEVLKQAEPGRGTP